MFSFISLERQKKAQSQRRGSQGCQEEVGEEGRGGLGFYRHKNADLGLRGGSLASQLGDSSGQALQHQPSNFLKFVDEHLLTAILNCKYF